MSENWSVSWSQMLEEAVSKPGMLLKAYHAFHGYSLGNQMAAIIQCYTRGISPGPINTYKGWEALGRNVKKGEKAIWLCMPMTGKGTRKDRESGEDAEYAFRYFVWRPRWFVLSQTEGEEIEIPKFDNWNKDLALNGLGVKLKDFELTNGNVMGYARKREIAINPVNPIPWKTLFHELGHVVAGHTEEADFEEDETTPINIREVEAEGVALLCCETLEVSGADYCRGYIQKWLDNGTIPEKSAQKIFKTANQILSAGVPDDKQRTELPANSQE